MGVGIGVGTGTAVGIGVGIAVGFIVGFGVGFTIGLGVGFAVGTAFCTTCCDVVVGDAVVRAALFVPAIMLEKPEHRPHTMSNANSDRHPTPSFVPFF